MVRADVRNGGSCHATCSSAPRLADRAQVVISQRVCLCWLHQRMSDPTLRRTPLASYADLVWQLLPECLSLRPYSSPAGHSVCPHLQAIANAFIVGTAIFAALWYPHSPECAHLSAFFSAMTASSRVHLHCSDQAGANGRLKARNPLEGGVQRVLGSLVAAPWSQWPHHAVCHHLPQCTRDGGIQTVR